MWLYSATSLSRSFVRIMIITYYKKAFRYEAYHPLVLTVVLQWPPDFSTGWGGGTEVNMFEQVSSAAHWMSRVPELGVPVQWGPLFSEVPCSEVWGRGGAYSEVQCIMDNDHMGSPCEQTDTIENITFLQLCLRTVNMCSHRALVSAFQSRTHFQATMLRSMLVDTPHFSSWKRFPNYKCMLNIKGFKIVDLVVFLK